MKPPLLSLLCLSLVFGGCALVPSPYSAHLNPAVERYNAIASGASRADIEARLGKPVREEDGASVWETRFDDKNYALMKVWFEGSDKASKAEITKAHSKSVPGFRATAVVTHNNCARSSAFADTDSFEPLPDFMSNDPIHTLSGSDPEMNAAIKKAQETFPEFVKELELESRRVVPALDQALVKAFFFEPATPERGEHMFVNRVRVEGGVVHGILASAPRSVGGLREGQEVSFPISRISDWFIVIEGRGRGGHTLDVIAKRMPKAAYAQASKHPPFAWFAWRKQP